MEKKTVFEPRLWGSQKAEPPFPDTVGSLGSNQRPERSCLGYQLRTGHWPHASLLGNNHNPRTRDLDSDDGKIITLSNSCSIFHTEVWLAAMNCSDLHRLDESECDVIRQEAPSTPTLSPFRKNTGLNKFKKWKRSEPPIRSIHSQPTRDVPGTNFYIERVVIPRTSVLLQPFVITQHITFSQGQTWKGDTATFWENLSFWLQYSTVHNLCVSYNKVQSLHTPSRFLHVSWGWCGGHLARTRMG